LAGVRQCCVAWRLEATQLSSSMGAAWLVYAFGAAVRLVLFDTRWLRDAIRARVEVSTPVNAWARVEEGVFLQRQGVEVYSGGLYHGTPLELWACSGAVGTPLEKWLPLLFTACDLLTAWVLGKVAASYGRRMLKQEASSSPPSPHPSLLASPHTIRQSVIEVSAVYLLCPYSILSCVAMTTTTVHNLVVALAILTAANGWCMLFGCTMALAVYQTMYPVVLLVPGLIAVYHASQGTKGAQGTRGVEGDKSDQGATAVYQSLATFVLALAALLWVSASLTGSWQFMEATYGFLLSAPDLSPNIGLFWYFFTEMFEHFRLFFLAVFQLNAVVYVAPLCTRLPHSPLLLTTSLLLLSTAFRPYPCLAHCALYLALLPALTPSLAPFMHQSLVVACVFVATSVLGPLMYHLWIFSGAANANFYFAVTLAFNAGQIFLATDLLFAHLKRGHLLAAPLKEGARLSLE